MWRRLSLIHIFIKKFLLASGSLKEVAGLYGVTYPTVRLRLDRLIDVYKRQHMHYSDTHGPAFDAVRERHGVGACTLACIPQMGCLLYTSRCV